MKVVRSGVDKTRLDVMKIVRMERRTELNKRRPAWLKIVLRHYRVAIALILLPFWILLFFVAAILSIEKDQPWFDLKIDRFVDWLDQ